MNVLNRNGLLFQTTGLLGQAMRRVPKRLGREPGYGVLHRDRQRRTALFIAFTLVLLVWFGWSSAEARSETIRIVGFGDSLMAGFELPPEAAFPVKLEAALRAAGYDVTIENAGVSGDTASGGLARLDWSVPDGVDGVILELGANDALRGIEPAITEQALDDIVTKLNARGIAVLLAGMRAPRNMGADYIDAFDGLYMRLAERHEVVFYPFFLEGVAADPSLNLADGIHPNTDGVDVIVERILPKVEELIALIESSR